MSEQQGAVQPPPWYKRHPWLAAIAGLVTLALLVTGTVFVIQRINAPALDCSTGMVPNGPETACVGLDLQSTRISPGEPAEFGKLEGLIKKNNENIGDNYYSIVLLLDLSPLAGVDTVTYSDLMSNVSGAITAVWQANHTAAYAAQSSPAERGEQPKIKLFLANMGVRYADWNTAVEQIGLNRKANRITGVVGLGQSTLQTRRAAAKITRKLRIPVVGATVTGNSMNRDPSTGEILPAFFRVSPTNTGMVAAATRYVREIEPDPARVAVVRDTVDDDDYTETLGDAAVDAMPNALEQPFVSPDVQSVGLGRRRYLALVGPFAQLDSNVCQRRPSVVYFAGRGTDLGTFAQSWVQANTACSHRPLTILTGDDGAEAIQDAIVAGAVNDRLKIQYTALASPDEWPPCGQQRRGGPDRGPYDQFRAAFTGRASCDAEPAAIDGAQELSLDPKYLESGQAMLTHDATAIALLAARKVGPPVLDDPMPQVSVLLAFRCASAFHGASGQIAFGTDGNQHGNPISSRLPILQVTGTGSASTVSAGWPTNPLNGQQPDTGCS